MPVLLITVFQLLASLFGLYNSDSAPSGHYLVEVSDNQYNGFVRALKGHHYELTRLDPERPYYRLVAGGPIDADLLESLAKAKVIARWHYDELVKPRNTPNDPFFPDQWDMVRIGMPEAWNKATGGITVNGDTIVVAILDTGFDTDHPDLVDNLWKNPGEIPNDNIDNDLNGYVDDYLGLNIKTGNDQHEEDVHGTAVAGIIGGRGNNNIGICGVNWSIRIILISGIQRESDIIEGYVYSRALRNKYNATNGAGGAFVVATSLSAGIDNAFADDHPMWCEQYNMMGASGIVSICATTNANSDVDEFGDMPTTCPSNYMIAVTNTGMNDQKLVFAGYGKTHVDLGAPGTPSLSTDPGGDYEDFEGTSAAAPHVGGAITLLYSAACNEVISLAKSEPSSLALQMKSLVMDNVDVFSHLSEFTVTSGRLNVVQALGSLETICGNTGGKVEILGITPNPASGNTTISYHLPDLNPYKILVFDPTGRLVREISPATSIPGEQIYDLDISGLAAGVYYVSLEQRNETDTKALAVQ